MGSGITLAMMNAGIPVTMVERDEAAIAAGREGGARPCRAGSSGAS